MIVARERTRLGWREWVGLPDLELPRIKAKIDTGARTSALHAHFVETFERDGEACVRFGLRPRQGAGADSVVRETRLHDRRVVTDSGGHRSERCVILTRLRLGADLREVEITLTDRDTMQFRMLIGRSAIRGDYIVDPAVSYRLGKP